MSRRFVFVPIFGDTQQDHPDAWLKAPHVKAWGFLSEHDGPNGGNFLPIHTDPPCAAITLFEDTLLFDNEGQAAVDVPENDTSLPDEVCLALAKLALCPPACQHDWGGPPSYGAECLRCGAQCEQMINADGSPVSPANQGD